MWPPSDPKAADYQKLEQDDIAKWAAKTAGENQTLSDHTASGQVHTQTDPTIAHAGLTELDTAQPTTQMSPSNNDPTESSVQTFASVGDMAANAAGANRWDSKPITADDPMAESYEIIPRPNSEVESPLMPAPLSSTMSWADEASDAVAAAQQNPNAEFQEVHHRNSRGRGGFPGGFNGSGQGNQWQGYRGRGGAPTNQQNRGNGNYNNYGRGGRGGRGDGRGDGRGFRGGRTRGAPPMR